MVVIGMLYGPITHYKSIGSRIFWNIDDLSDVLTILSTNARLETTSPEIEAKYEQVRESFANVDFNKFEEGTYFLVAREF